MSDITLGVAWNDSYRVGNVQVDAQHKRLFEMVSDLVKACTDGSDTERLKETLMFLGKYTVQHFYFEEELQRRYNFPEYSRHKQLHEDFKRTVGELTEKFNKNSSSAELSNDVNKIVVRWLIEHIMREDKKIGEYL